MSSSEAYKKGEGYNCLAGRDASRALAVMSLQPADCVSKIDDITEVAWAQTLAESRALT